MRAALLAILLLGCAPLPVHLPDDQARIFAAVEQAWSEAGLPELGGCFRGVRVEWARDAADFEARCGVPPDKAASCVDYRKERRGMKMNGVAVALLRPGQGLTGPTGGPVAHELLHIAYECTLGQSKVDRWDGEHRDLRIWARGGPDSAEQRARTLLTASAP